MSGIPADIRESLENRTEVDNPEMHRLRQADRLIVDPENNLTEYSNDECIDFALLEALHKSEIISLKGSMIFLQLLKRNRTSLDRKRTDEYIKAVIGQIQPLPSAYAQVGAPGSFDAGPDKPGLMDRFKNWWKS